MENNILLSILIPTYNGSSKYLVDVLDNLVKGIELCESNEIEVIISNNASTDDTEPILCEYDRYPFIKHYTNSENVGFARNIVLLTDTYANGYYGWVIGDDDLIAPHALPFLFDKLRAKDLDYLSLGFKFIRNISEMKASEILNYDITTSTFAGALEKGGKGNILGTFMSSAIFKLSLFRAVNKDEITNSFDTYQSVFPNGYLNATAFYNKKCGIVKTPILYPIQHNKDWATADNDYMIRTRILPDFYNYIISLGVKSRELNKTHNRMLHDALMTGYSRWIKGQKVDRNFYRQWFKSFLHPYTHILVQKTIMGRIWRRIKGINQ